MIKKIVIFNVVILFCVSAFAQDKMDKPTFEHLVNYANCQYLMTFIEKYDAGKPYIKDTYEKRVKPVLQKATLENLNNVPEYSKIKALFPDGSNNVASMLAEEINQRKGKFDEVPDNNLLIKSLGVDVWKSIELKVVSRKIQKDIGTKFNSSPVQKPALDFGHEAVKERLNQNSFPLVQLQEKIDTLQKKYDTLQNDSKIDRIQNTISSLRMLVISCLVVFVLLITALFLWYKLQFNAENRNSSVRKFVKNVFFTSEEINKKFEKTQIGTNESESNDNVNQLEKRLNILAQQFGIIQSKVDSLINKETTNKSTTQSSDSTISKENGLYFASKSNKQLTEPLPSSTNASFKVITIKDNDAEFEYVGAVRNENWFEGVCTIENLANDNLFDKKNIATRQPGKVRKENDYWVVITPAKIKFI